MYKPEIQTYSNKYQSDVINLILDIQQNEFSIAITLEEQPDLKNISQLYQTDSGNFWVALSDSNAIGTIALQNLGNGIGILRKFFVNRDYRGKKFGTAVHLLKALIEWAVAHEYRENFLGTTSKYHAAHRFYEKNGFISISQNDLPDKFPLLEVDTVFYKYEL